MTTNEDKGKPLRATGPALVLIGMLLVPGLPPVAAAGTCTNYEDDWGFGGSNVPCDLPCKKGAFLLVAGHAQDPDAGISAKYNCGGQGAGCSLAAPTCAGASTYPTDKAEDATCWADSDEFWSSTVYVACAETGLLSGSDDDPIDRICQLIPKFPPCESTGEPSCESQNLIQCEVPDVDCDRIVGPLECTHTIAGIAALCVATVPELWTMTETDIIGLFPASFGGHILGGLRSLSYEPDHSVLSLQWNAVTGCSATRVSAA